MSKQTTVKNKEPLIHISKRGAIPWYMAWGIRGLALVLALVLCALITTVFTGEDPLAVYKAILQGGFGTPARPGCCSRTWPSCCAPLWR